MIERIIKWVLILLVVYGAIRFLANYRQIDRGRTGACVANLIQIKGAIEQWALENKKLDSDMPDLAAAAKYLKGGVLPQCPHGGS